MRNRLRLATWIVCLLAIMVSFACVITAANNIVENNAKVIFISGTGDDANSGLSPKQAVRHLQKATELLNGAGSHNRKVQAFPRNPRMQYGSSPATARILAGLSEMRRSVHWKNYFLQIRQA